ncbi:hypothetical protein PR202_ga19346 [Eleusine coracana subsp. coracana]|uniref:Uncharacterized protein n=1 Tax=Eleusine coracana subsp. coracana TaxID=191504 RepID=A0AAV5CVY4_ELECO|nr:hypothetical protein QOZ80_4AG0307130 [Eleusine coracana subsp. coracana]GJN02033.1 hypothetical protein PR202_ga19346 [Eleusine coracana subsp. coracana]
MEMAAAVQNGHGGVVEWRVTVPEGASVTVENEAGRAWAWLISCVLAFRDTVIGSAERVWKIGADDPRRAVHGVKVGLALALVSVFYYTRPLNDGVGGFAMWAVMTVVVVLEYTVGGCVYKGFNRAAATASAGVLALGVHWIASKSGDTFEPFIRSGSVFLLAAAATFSRFIPTVKARFDYGVTIFILTYSLVAVSGYRVDELLAMAQHRVSTISIGIAICFAVSVLVRPVWAGQELHAATARNMDKLAGAVEVCVDAYFSSSSSPSTRDSSSDDATAQLAKAEGYKCVLNSKASEDAQANLARWEPAHGRFGFRHPYAQYTHVGAAMRRCAYCVEALAACARASSADDQSQTHPPHDHAAKRHLAGACTRVAAQCARVLREAAGSVQTMTAASRSTDLAVAEMNGAVLEMRAELRALPSKLTTVMETTAEQELTAALMMDAAQLFTVTTLLVEVAARVEGVVDAVDTLATLAGFQSADDDKPGDDYEPTANKVQPVTGPDSELSEVDRTMKALDQQA